MNKSRENPISHNHITESALYLFKRGALSAEKAADIEQHLEFCLACRVWASRLEHAEIADPEAQVLSSLVESSRTIPTSLHIALASSQETERIPNVGELWRVGRDEALLVWVRRVLEDSAIVVPVVLDESMADDYSLIVAAANSAIDVELIFLTSVEGHVDFRAFWNLIESVPVHKEIEILRQARRTDRPPPSDIIVGPPLVREDDSRIEYRQVVSDLLAELSPAAFVEPIDSDTTDDGIDIRRLLEDLNEITWRRVGVHIRPIELASFAVDPAHQLLLVAAAEELDTCILVTILSGASPSQTLSDPAVAVACGSVLREHQDGDHVAVVIADADWTCVVVGAPYTARALEVPSGEVQDARVPFEPLPLLDALFKQLDAAVTHWDQNADVVLERDLFNLADFASSLTRQAVERLIASGRRSASPKKEVYLAFGEAEVQKVADLLNAVTARGVEAKQAVESLLHGPRR